MIDTQGSDDPLFDVSTPLGFHTRASQAHWKLIVTLKHPVMAGRENDVKQTLEYPEQARVSKSDPAVFLFYRADHKPGRWLCAVARRLNGDGFLITAYVTDAIKEGLRVWPK